MTVLLMDLIKEIRLKNKYSEKAENNSDDSDWKWGEY